MVVCQDPKPILFNVGDPRFFPIPWADNIMAIQLAQVGQLYILGIPAELTTMAGRRLKDAVRRALIAAGAPPDIVVVIAGMTNGYSHYVTTYEEYQIQRYEGASTLYGPHTLAAYQQLYSGLAEALVKGSPVPRGTPPPDLTNATFSLIPPVAVDATPFDVPFGTVYVDVKPSYTHGQQVEVVFWGGNPRNNFMTDHTFLTVEYLQSQTQTQPQLQLQSQHRPQQFNQSWVVVARDSEWETKMQWTHVDPNYSAITITWDIPTEAPSGSYRIGHFGHHKKDDGKTQSYSGYSSNFLL